MGSITLNKPSGGQLTIAPEDGVTNETVTIPAGGVMSADAPTGKVLQVVQGTGQTSTGNVSSASYTATGVKVTITPTSTDSKIFISGWMHVYKSSGIHFLATVYRDGTTQLFNGNGGSDNDNGTAHYDAPVSWVDSPNTTSPVTYEFYIRGRDASFNLVINDGGTIYSSNLVAMEVAQ